MAAWGTPGLRDDVTCFLLTRDGWRSTRDYVSSCVWCGLPFWYRPKESVVPDHADYCSKACWHRQIYWRAIALRGRAHLNRLSNESLKRRRAARRAARVAA